MLTSFAVFCAIVVLMIAGVRYFLFQSTIPMDATIQIARGTPTLVGTNLVSTAVTKPSSIVHDSTLTTDNQAQASILFYDPLHEDELVATVTVHSGSSLNLTQDTRPRFDLSSDAYWLDFDDVYGEFDVFVPEGLGRSVLIAFTTTLGPSARLTASGNYTLIAAGQQVQVTNYSGDALLGVSEQPSQPVPVGNVATVRADDNQVVLAPLTNLLGDSSFSTNNVLDFISSTDQMRDEVWRCLNRQVDDPPGEFGLTMVDGRPALRLLRDQGAESHGETTCLQGLGTGTGGLDVSSYSSISIRATFKIVSQSLSACGSQGSECPVMLRMDYIPVSGGTEQWYHGFYAFVDPNRFFPSSCDSCNEQHEMISPNVWYTYDSHNLKATFAPERVPQSILNLRFYASGHQYEVYVSQVALIADKTVIPLDG